MIEPGGDILRLCQHGVPAAHAVPAMPCRQYTHLHPAACLTPQRLGASAAPQKTTRRAGVSNTSGMVAARWTNDRVAVRGGPAPDPVLSYPTATGSTTALQHSHALKP